MGTGLRREMLRRSSASPTKHRRATRTMRAPPPRNKQGNASQLLQEALLLHQQGNLDQAELRYTMVLAAHPKQFDAKHLLGVIRLQQGRNTEALDHISAALKLKPRSALALSRLGWLSEIGKDN